MQCGYDADDRMGLLGKGVYVWNRCGLENIKFWIDFLLFFFVWRIVVCPWICDCYWLAWKFLGLMCYANMCFLYFRLLAPWTPPAKFGQSPTWEIRRLHVWQSLESVGVCDAGDEEPAGRQCWVCAVDWVRLIFFTRTQSCKTDAPYGNVMLHGIISIVNIFFVYFVNCIS